MERVTECDNFLKYFAKVVSQNPNTAITTDTIYYSLTRYNVDSKYLDVNIEALYPRWIERFKNNPNIKVFVQSNWKYFCQFKNNPYKSNKLSNPIKMYIPVIPEKIEYCANLIFDFMSKENIYHDSKIGKNVRNDNIVIRVYNESDARKISNFVNSRHDIKKNVMKTNPFVYNSASIGYAIDGTVSYNNVVSAYIANYINVCRRENHLSMVSVLDFYNYLKNTYYYFFVEKGHTDDIYDLFKVKNTNRPKEEIINNYREVTKLLMSSIKSNNMSEYFTYLQEFNDPEKYKNSVNQFKEESYTQEDQQLFNEFVLISVKKYGLNKGRELVDAYINKGLANAVTRTNDLRTRVTSMLPSSKCKLILNNRSLDSYIAGLVNVDTHSIEQTALNNAIRMTYNKYGAGQTVLAICRSFDGQFNYFTNDGNVRTNLMATVCKENIENIIKNAMNSDIIDSEIITDYVNSLMGYGEKGNNERR